jgi:hypothetical protein
MCCTPRGAHDGLTAVLDRIQERLAPPWLVVSALIQTAHLCGEEMPPVSKMNLIHPQLRMQVYGIYAAEWRKGLWPFSANSQKT